MALPGQKQPAIINLPAATVKRVDAGDRCGQGLGRGQSRYRRFLMLLQYCSASASPLECPAIHQSSLRKPHARASEAPLEKPAADCRNDCPQLAGSGWLGLFNSTRERYRISPDE